tara:strand:+ start:1270 stop:1734 length:465 start_codon:yes stop_codon:yes gene_type:complete
MKKISILILVYLFINGCGYKIVNKDKAITFNIIKVNTTGEKRINYKLRNKLLSFNKIGNNPITINLKTSKVKTIKEKNIKNEITKYSINITADITIEDSANNEIEKFKFDKIGEYNVAKQHSQSLNNEKKLINLMTESLQKKIIDELIIRLNDL